MLVHGLDHVNIIARDIAESVQFYADVLGLEPRDPPGPPRKGCWLHDGTGRAIIHLGSADESYVGERDVGASTAAVHHVALACSGFDEMLARLQALGVPHRVGGITGIGFRQIFITDPSNVSLELNFPD